MQSSAHVIALNDTTNQLYSALETKEQWYKLLMSILPKDKYRYATYIKKTKVEKDKDEKVIVDTLAANLEMSRREVTELLHNKLTDQEKLKETFK